MNEYKKIAAHCGWTSEKSDTFVDEFLLPFVIRKEGLEKKGFSLLEFLAPCPTAYGRRNKLGDIKKHWAWYDDNTILIEDYQKIMNYGTEKEKEQIKDKMQIGVFQDIQKSGFFEEYEKLVERLQLKEKKSDKVKGGKK